MKSNRRRYVPDATKASEKESGKILLILFLEVVWNCIHCLCSKEDAGFIKLGPNGEESLCESCGSYYEIHEELPDHRLNLCRYAV